ncbi:MAG: LL-diaminopimelate aminotransferase [Simkania sp.]|nr:LL-diaminopimelate aminotransferase [Simkania sp.]
MPKINPSYSLLKTPYIFPIIEEKLALLETLGLKESVINLGIGDVALPLAPAIAEAICSATREMTHPSGKKGYGPSEGYFFLRETICNHEYASFGFSPEEIFISDGTNSDTANIQELFATDCKVAITNPTYPVYLASNVMAGRNEHILFLPCLADNGFHPQPPEGPCDLIFLCSPSNPTGTAMDHALLKRWVDYAIEKDAVIVFDNAYAAFIRSPNIPLSIYEIEGAHKVAIECRSFSKAAGFTGLRCAYTVVPKTLPHGLHTMWRRRQSTKSNGVAYPIQRGAEATFSKEGYTQVKAQVDIYLESGKILREALHRNHQTFYGGIDAPYIWWKTPNEMNSWQFFDHLLDSCRIIGIPGLGFGSAGEGYLRLSTFTVPAEAQEAAVRLASL